MKRKLLTVLLAVVMVFGVFGLTACSKSNADADYNYYGVKYEIEDEVKIDAVTFQAVYKMFTTAGKFLLYVDSGSNKANYQAINKLANDWNVTIYHFNPDLTGGFAKDVKEAQNANLCSDLTGVAAESQVKAVQDLLLEISGKKLADWKGYEGQLLAITGAESTVANGALKYNGKVTAANSVADGAKSIAAISIKNPSYGAYTDEAKDVPYIPAAYNTDAINTMNLFADARLHIYDDRDAITEEKTDVFVTVANYEMFAHLLDYNQGYFAVFFGGTWCPNTQAILYHVNYLAKDYGMNKVYFFDPRLDDGVRLDKVNSTTTWDEAQFAEDNFKAELAFELGEEAIEAEVKALADAVEAAQEALADYKDTGAELDAAIVAAQKALADATEAYEAKVDAAADAIGYAKIAKDELKNPTAAQTTAADKAITDAQNAYNALVAGQAKALEAETKALQAAQDDKAAFLAAVAACEADVTDYIIAYDLNPNEANIEFAIGKVVATYEAASAEAAKAAAATGASQTVKDAAKAAAAKVEYVKAAIADFAEEDELEAALEAALEAQDEYDEAAAYEALYEEAKAAYTTAGTVTTYSVVENSANITGNLNTRNNDATGEKYNYNYTYGSFLANYIPTYWSEWNITAKLSITVNGVTKDYTRMCVPNIMMFNGEAKDAKAELIALAEAEYYWANTSVEGDPYRLAWEAAVKEVYDANPYATYAPIIVVEESAAADTGAAAGGSSAPAAGGAAEAC